MSAPPIERVLETVLYVDDIGRARRFYEETLGLSPIMTEERMAVFKVAPGSLLILFLRGTALETLHLPGGTIPPHDGRGSLHMAFAIAADALPAWESYLADKGVGIEGRTDWPNGGHSVYFRDPDENLLELATPGLWE